MVTEFMHTGSMRTGQKHVLVAGLSLALCIVSATLASTIGESSSDGRSNWDGLGTAIWITLLVTIPAFCVFLVTAVVAAIEYVHSHKR